jgi:alkylation response protein AidB-like acyl-CoA dehydrogenase
MPPNSTRRIPGINAAFPGLVGNGDLPMMVAEPDASERRKAISAAKVQIGRSGRIVGHGAIQLHGGIGMTMEYKVGHYFKRVTAIDTAFGDADYHLGLLAKTDGLVPPLT